MTPIVQGIGFLIVTIALMVPIYLGLRAPSVRDFKVRRAITGFWMPAIIIAVLWLLSAYMIFVQP
jgi:hypothetical protein